MSKKVEDPFPKWRSLHDLFSLPSISFHLSKLEMLKRYQIVRRFITRSLNCGTRIWRGNTQDPLEQQNHDLAISLDGDANPVWVQKRLYTGRLLG
ncbi:hypothetical protein TNCV_3045151 [Trichonephila clavipes]|nr:hypothetical protein TNCV_3045151 [Trichonephila clavipes]